MGSPLWKWERGGKKVEEGSAIKEKKNEEGLGNQEKP